MSVDQSTKENWQKFIPTDWKIEHSQQSQPQGLKEQWNQRKREEPVVAPKELVKDKANLIDVNNDTILSRETKTPSTDNPLHQTVSPIPLFYRDLNALITYTTERVKDKRIKLLIPVLRSFFDDVASPAMKKDKLIIPKEFKKEVVEQAKVIEDGGELIGKVSDLFAGRYTKRTASVANLLRKLATDLVSKLR